MPSLSSTRRRIVLALGALAFLVVPAVAGYEVGQDGGSPTSADAASTLVPGGATPRPSSGDGGLPTQPGDSSSGSSGSSGSTGSSSSQVAAIADQVDDAVVNVVTTVEGGGQAAGTGIVISERGLVLTNNHVIAGATALTVEFGESGVTRSAKVLGYSVVDDVALIQVQNVSDLPVADLGSSSSLSVGETIVAIGNAGGRGGSPSVVAGTVTALEQEITASDSDGSNSQTLDGLIQVAAAIQSGDSGGPVVEEDGTVVGMNVAASVSSGFGFPGGSSTGEGYAIPIEDAVAIVKKIVSGQGGPDIRIGATRALLGVQIQPQLSAQQRNPGGVGGSGTGANVVGVESGSGADKAGLAAGDVIVALDGSTIATTSDLTRTLVPYSPGDSVEVTWRDSSGSTRHATATLGEGPPA
jgi:S1-C subfamily serine protease